MPILGLELAEHGSLDFVLRCLGPGPSVADREHLTVDMALGLRALHSCGIAHGDLKCESMLVFLHPTRRIVAKLADFGGSVLVADATARPRHHTELWDSPESLLGDENIDWTLADVYAFGLVPASLWMRTSTNQGLALDPAVSIWCLERLAPNSSRKD
ncbi:kinase-like domain-containing protein [Lasiosphaeria miniovina]|uniref:Kinase-like domain-containing protein n=1 Tax=Lasiosphaeria miniovina TaxID=1954250 RepID=A0AA40AB19_9PEZI|nr:kinase-like domain-containing protein [Lasiosphaeria miniovina]KAK0712620.1 kinase-like domain-containing protein [Lasiosphaeria miniovina]